ncbi:putative reverse transcriptase domain-containing protein, partial [Tanacetum coccineum]
VKDYDINAYTACFNELVLLCPKMVSTEKKKIRAYIRSLSNNIKGEVTSSEPTTLNAIDHMAHTLMEQKRLAKAERDAKGKKRKWENFQSRGSNNNNNSSNQNNNRGNNRQNQQSHRGSGNARAMTAAQNEQAHQMGTAPKCNRCGLCHFGNCPVKCDNCGKMGHKTRECRGKAVAM